MHVVFLCARNFELTSVPWKRQRNCYNISDPAMHWKTKQEMLGSKAKGIISDSILSDLFLHVLDQWISICLCIVFPCACMKRDEWWVKMVCTKLDLYLDMMNSALCATWIPPPNFNVIIFWIKCERVCEWKGSISIEVISASPLWVSLHLILCSFCIMCLHLCWILLPWIFLWMWWWICCDEHMNATECMIQSIVHA